MKLAICGTDEKALKLKRMLDIYASSNIETHMFIGPYMPEVEGTGIPIISESELMSSDYSNRIDGFVISPEYYGLTRMNAYKKIKSSHYANKNVYMPDFEVLHNLNLGKNISLEKILVPIEDSSQMFYLEIHAADHCNLNCKGCMHFSPLAEGKVLPAFEQLSADIRQLRRFIRHIDIIRILGGEPLLNPELERIIRLIRVAYPYSNIILVTNGILIEKMSRSLCETIRDKMIHVNVSLYPPVEKRRSSIASFLKENNIIFRISNRIDAFTTTYRSQPYINKALAKEQCEIFCNNLRDGKMSSCPNIMYTHFYNDYFGTKYPVEDGMVDIFKIHSARELHEQLKKPASLCSYCDRTLCFDWSISRKKCSDWLAVY